MIRLFLSLVFLVISCSNPIASEEDCECVFEITSTLPSINQIYQLEWIDGSIMTYSSLDILTECGWAQHIKWESDLKYQMGPDLVNLVNSSSHTDENGDAKIWFGVWPEFINKTITIYGRYVDDHGHEKTNSIRVKVVDNE